MTDGIVFNIQRYTIHDGPGIRTELFLKGCPLSCRWCGNPESHRARIQAGVYSTKCIGAESCGLCKTVCESDALLFEGGTLVGIDREKCTDCMACADICPADAIKRWGERTTVAQAMEIIRKDIPYYNRSGGGVTLSGGEPLVQIDFVTALLKQCKAESIHTCVESTLYADWQTIEQILPYTDLIITDIKLMDSALHKRHIGAPNERILDNIERLAQRGVPMIVRIPIIPQVNDSMENIAATADFITDKLDNRILQLQLLEFMRLGEEKYKSLGIDYPMAGVEIDKDAFTQKIKEFADVLNRRGIPAVTGTTTKEKRA